MTGIEMLPDFRRIFAYDPLTGEFRYKIDRGAIKAGSLAGSIDSKGYLDLRVNKKGYRGHRVAWLLHYGVWPNGFLDHKNGNPADNRICNLRECTVSENAANKKGRGAWPKGVTRNKNGKFQAQIKHLGKNQYLGQFDNPEAAHVAYMRQARKIFGDFATDRHAKES